MDGGGRRRRPSRETKVLKLVVVQRGSKVIKTIKNFERLEFSKQAA